MGRHVAAAVAAVWIGAWLGCSASQPAPTAEQAPQPDAPKPASPPEPAAPPSEPLQLPAAEQDMIDVADSMLRPLIAAQQGKAVIVNMWASWCGSCKKEIPLLQQVASDFSEQGISLLLISADRAQDRSKAAQFLRDKEIPLPGYLIGGRVGPFKRAINPRWNGGIPATFLYDVSPPRLRYYWAGPVFERELIPVIQGYLAGDAIDGEYIPPLSQGKSR